MGNKISEAKRTHKIMHVVEAFGAGVGHSVHQIYSKYTEDIPGVLVYGGRDLNADLLDPSLNMRYMKWSADREINIKKDYFAFKELLNFIDSEKPSVIHCHSSKAGVLGRIAARIKGVPCIYTPHSYAFLRKDISRLQTVVFKLIEKVLASSSITVACGLEEFSLARSMSSKVEIVENGVNLDIFSPGISDKYGRFTFVNVGRRAPQKDFPFFCEIAAHPKMSHCDFIWITGEQHEDYRIGHNTNVLGARKPRQIVDILQRSHCFLNTSLWEGLSRAVIEGAACGLPLLLRNAPGNREIAFRPLAVELFSDFEECLSFALDLKQRCENDPRYGLLNSEKVKDFYNSSKTQSRIRSIYDAVAFSRLDV